MARVQIFTLTKSSYSPVLYATGSVCIGCDNGLGIEEDLVNNKTFTASSELKADFVLDPKVNKWARFQILAKKWKEERGAMASISEMSLLPAYQQIIGLGEDVIPMILAELDSERDDPDQWFWALRALTDDNPIDPEDQGNFPAMAGAWLRWGEREGYVW
jgi:hypothetical protein